MTRKPARIVVLAGVVVLVLAAWQVGAAKGKRDRKGKKAVLSPAAAAAIRKAFPGAAIDEVEREKEGVVLYEVELKRNGKEIEVELTPGGQIVEVGRKVARVDLPEAVARALAKLAGRAKVKEIEREEIHAVVKLVKLQKPRVVYEAEFVRDGKEVEVKIAENGTVLVREIEDDDDNDDDDEDEKEISLDRVPAAVKATILKEAGKNRIKEIEVEGRGGKKIYEAEWEADGKEVEIKVASDGKLLGKEVEDEDDD